MVMMVVVMLLLLLTMHPQWGSAIATQIKNVHISFISSIDDRYTNNSPLKRWQRSMGK
jgi:hypothetical protein